MLSDYIWNLRAKLGSELILVPSVAAVITNAEGHILLQEKSQEEGWSLPAGAIELGETPQEALAREIQEETGLELVSATLTAVFGGKSFRYIYPNGDEVEYTVILFHCEVQGTQAARDAETRSLRYFSWDDMPTLALPYPKEILFAGADLDL